MSIKKKWVMYIGIRMLLLFFTLQVGHYTFSQIWFDTTATMDKIRAELENKQLKHDLDARNSDGVTGLMLACMRGDAQRVELLLKFGASPNLKSPEDVADIPFDRGENSALHYALYFATANVDTARIVKQLIAHGADVRARNGNGDTPLHYILNIPMLRLGERSEILKELLAKGADINTQNYGVGKQVYKKQLIGDTMLHYAAANNEIEWIRELRKNYIKILSYTIKNSEGRTPADLVLYLGKWQEAFGDLLMPPKK